MEQRCSLKVFQFALYQLRRTEAAGAAEGGASVSVIELWSEVVSWFVARERIEEVMSPQERQRSIVDGVLAFLGWWVGSPGTLCSWKWLDSSHSARVWLAGDVRAV